MPISTLPADAGGRRAVHGLSDIFLSDKPRFAESCEELLEFIGDSPLVAHNASFDFGFLNHELTLCGRPLVCMTRMVDTLTIARQRHPGAKHSLDALCTRFGVDRSLRIKHGALIDAQLLAQCYVELTGGRQIGLSLVSDLIDAAPVWRGRGMRRRSASSSARRATTRRARTSSSGMPHL
jgi:DNA polymerase-3 subunit epsilon